MGTGNCGNSETRLTAGSCMTTRDVHLVCQEFKPNFRLPGPSIYDSQLGRVNTIADCARLCEADPVCKAWSFDNADNNCIFGNTAETIPCVMGTGNCGNSETRLTAGSCMTTRDVHLGCQEFKPNFRLPGPSIYNSQLGRVNTIADCARLCEADPMCKAWSFDNSDNNCIFGNTAETIPCVMGTGNCGNSETRLTAGSCTTTRALTHSPTFSPTQVR